LPNRDWWFFLSESSTLEIVGTLIAKQVLTKSCAMKYIVLIFSLTILAMTTSAEVPYERQDNEHIREILTAWDQEKGAWLYDAMDALVMQAEYPSRPTPIIETPFELASKISDSRRQRLERAAEDALSREQETSTSDRYYWAVWLDYFRRSECAMNQGRSNGDPHMRTFDGEKYDFQTAGEYLLVESATTPMRIQTRQVRHNEKVSVNAAVVMDVNGDVVSFYAQDFPDGYTDEPMRINGEVVKGSQDPIYLKNGGVVRFKDGRHVVNWPTGEQLQVKSRTFSGSRLLDIDVFVPECAVRQYSGLLSDVIRIDELDFEASETRRDATPGFFSRNRPTHDVFGIGRNNPVVLGREQNALRFMAEQFGDRYVLGTEESMFEQPMGLLPDHLRFPREYITLNQLTDEQIREAMEECKAAGVAEEDLMDCVYDRGYVGLEPDLPPSYDGRVRNKPTSANQPSTAPQEQLNQNNNPNTAPTVFPPRRRPRGIFIPAPRPSSGSGTRTPSGGGTGGRTPPSQPRTPN
jgi:hypothetical protein